MSEDITLLQTSKEKVFKLDVEKDIITEREYLKELDARIANLEKLFSIKVKRVVTHSKTGFNVGASTETDKVFEYIKLTKAEQEILLLDLELTQSEIDKLSNEEARIRKLIEIDGD